MKKIIFSFLFVTIFAITGFSQYATEFLDTNNWSAGFHPINSSFWDLQGQSITSIPKDEGTTAIFSMNFWLGGYDDDGNLHMSADRYGVNDYVFEPGPYGFLPNSAPYNKIWKINKEDIEYHINHWNDPGYVMPDAIATWPAHGDTSNNELYILAPFVDVNGNGHYDPAQGDYPYILGDQALYYIINDKASGNTVQGSPIMGVEVRVMAFAFEGIDSVLDNTFFIHFDIINRSGNNYHNVKFAVNVDFDLGNPFDDYIGCDSTQNAFFCYNGDEDDDGPHGYGLKPPAVGVVFLDREMTSFMYYINGGGPMGDPETATEYYNYMNNRWKDGSHLVHHGTGHYPDATDTCDFAFPEYSGWNEMVVDSAPGDRRGIATLTAPFLSSNSCMTVDIAFTWARDTTSDYQNSHTPVEKLLAQVPHIIDFVNNLDIDTNCTYLTIANPYLAYKDITQFVLSPNPASNVVMVTTNLKQYDVTIFDELGRVVYQGHNPKQIDVSGLSKGMYVVKATSEHKTIKRKLVIK